MNEENDDKKRNSDNSEFEEDLIEVSLETDDEDAVDETVGSDPKGRQNHCRGRKY